jgi:NitT/TauT family transport system substrate-binding protein
MINRKYPSLDLSAIGSRIVALSALAAFGLCFAGTARAQTSIKIGVISANESQLPVRVAIDEGFFKQQNIDVELTEFRGGGVAVQAFVGKSIDLCDCSTDHVVRLNNRGVDARMLVGIDRFNTNTLVVSASAGFTDLVSLRGKKIGVSAPGSYSDNTVRWAIKSAGLDPDRDFEIVGVGAGTTARAALETGQISAVMASTPAVLDYDLSAPGKFKVLIDWRKVDYSGQAIIASRQWADANPQVARGFVRAITEAEHVIQTDEKPVERAFKEMFPDRDDKYLEILSRQIREQLSPDGRISQGGFLKMIEIMQVVEPNLKAIKQSDVDLQPVLSKSQGQF